VGRVTLLNAQLQRKICGLFAQGHTVSAVCGAVGIGTRTFMNGIRNIRIFRRHARENVAAYCPGAA
jgi:hypothetical protein